VDTWVRELFFYFVLRGNRLNWLGDGRERQLTVLTHRPTHTQTIA